MTTADDIERVTPVAMETEVMDFRPITEEDKRFTEGTLSKCWPSGGWVLPGAIVGFAVWAVGAWRIWK